MNPQNIKEKIKKIRPFVTFYHAKQTLKHLEVIRINELQSVLEIMPSKGNLLEIGAGTGWQSKILEEKGYTVSAIDVPNSRYKDDRVWAVKEYNGKTIPFEDSEFDIIYSSNVLEHIPDVKHFQKEIHRVLKPNGIVIHVLPSASWRFWTIITGVVSWIKPPVHGEHASNSISEIYYFSQRWWNELFSKANWSVLKVNSNKLFYTGYSIMDSRLNMNIRKKLSYILGGSCNIFVLKKENIINSNI